MMHNRSRWTPGMVSAFALVLTLASACAPAATPTPTSPAAKPAATLSAPAPTSAPAPATAASPSAAAKPAASPAAPSGAAALRYTPPATPPKLSQTTVKVASVSTSWTVRMAPLVAKEKGYWTQEGLTPVDLTIVGPAPTHMAGLIGGGFDFSINLSTDTLIRANAQGEKVFAVAGSSNAPNYSLFGKGVAKVADLKGKTIATDAPGGTGELLTVDILKKYGLKREDVNLVPVAGTVEEREQAVLTGVASAALGSGAAPPRMGANGAVLLANVSEVYPEFQFAVTAARGDILDQHPDTAVAFLKGLVRGFAYLQDPANEREILQILKKNDVAVDEANWTETLKLQRGLMTTDGSPTLRGTEVVIGREKEAGRIPADYTTAKLFRSEALEKAQKELGLRP